MKSSVSVMRLFFCLKHWFQSLKLGVFSMIDRHLQTGHALTDLVAYP